MTLGTRTWMYFADLILYFSCISFIFYHCLSSYGFFSCAWLSSWCETMDPYQFNFKPVVIHPCKFSSCLVPNNQLHPEALQVFFVFSFLMLMLLLLLLLLLDTSALLVFLSPSEWLSVVLNIQVLTPPSYEEWRSSAPSNIISEKIRDGGRLFWAVYQQIINNNPSNLLSQIICTSI